MSAHPSQESAFKHQHIKLDEKTTERLSDVDIVFLEDLARNYTRSQELSFGFTDVILNCVFTRDQLRDILFLKFVLRIRY